MANVAKQDISFSVLDYKLPAISFVPEAANMGFILWLYGGGSSKDRHTATLKHLAVELNVPVFCFDYAGHGEAPFDIRTTTAAQHMLEVVSVYDQLCAQYGCSGGVVIGGSYGSYMLLELLKYRQVRAGILRVPALLRPSSFYTHWELIDRPSNLHWQDHPADIIAHPLVERAKGNTAPLLIVEHENDAEIPSVLPQTLHKKLTGSEYVLFAGVAHSLKSATKEQQLAYEKMLIDWLSDKV